MSIGLFGGGGSSELQFDTDVSLTSPANGQILRYDGTHWVNSGGLVKIQDGSLTGSAASVTFGSIPQGYLALKLFCLARCDNAVTQNIINLTFNGDTGAHYNYQNLTSSFTTVSEGNGLAQTSAGIGWATGASATAGKAAQSEITVVGYAQTTFNKAFASIATLDRGTATTDQFTWQSSGNWLSTAAITSVTLTPAAGNFIAGSVFILYGLS